jgi:hypothetical protein
MRVGASALGRRRVWTRLAIIEIACAYRLHVVGKDLLWCACSMQVTTSLNCAVIVHGDSWLYPTLSLQTLY